ncbi:unnamed protein product [Urochloa humidicola]
MADYCPPSFPYCIPPPSGRALSPPPPLPFHPTSHTSRDNSPSSPSASGVIAAVAISVGVFLLVLTFVCSLRQGYCKRRANAASEAAAAAALAAHAARRRTPPPVTWGYDENEEQRLRSGSASDGVGGGRPRRASPAAGLPSFTYNRSVSVRHNVTAGGEEAVTCSVCLGAFQTGETVRLLPVCLHLFHVECIDPWLDAHSTCPICRSGIDPNMDGSLIPPV